MLDDRKQRILQAIIDDYIENGEPVGSKTVARKYGISLSSATIRNEMALLEEQGFITQPHTSAGRVPSERGFRLYVDELVRGRSISVEDAGLVNSILDDSVTSMKGLLQKISYILSNVSGYTVFGCEKKEKGIILDAVRIVKVEEHVAAVMIIDSNKHVYTELIRVNEIDVNLLNGLSEYLTNKYTGKPLKDLEKENFSEFEYRDIVKENVFIKVIYAIKDMEYRNLVPDILIEGVTNFLDYPEFNDIISIKNVMNLMNDKKTLLSILLSNLTESIDIKIGSEHPIKGFENISTISANMRGGINANICIMGPIRMEYGRIISIMSYLRMKLQNNR
ncbi:MAG TPA: heat-inducible transcription repressor HrcA [Clostridiales bacterium]|nr:heat-inducible transcription repressor HrcA [Clostridiales bacterium]